MDVITFALYPDFVLLMALFGHHVGGCGFHPELASWTIVLLQTPIMAGTANPSACKDLTNFIDAPRYFELRDCMSAPATAIRCI
jgi:hypothetical protein